MILKSPPFCWSENKWNLKQKLCSIWFEEVKLGLLYLKSILIWIEIINELDYSGIFYIINREKLN